MDETLRIVQALKLVDEYGGSALAPGDWRVGEPYIGNTRPGVDTFYAARAGLNSNVFLKIFRMVQSLFTPNEEEITSSESNKSMKELQLTLPLKAGQILKTVQILPITVALLLVLVLAPAPTIPRILYH